LDGVIKRKVAVGRYPYWSPVGNYIIFIGFHNEIYRVNINDTSDVDRLTSLNQSNIYPTDNSYPRYSPDGTKIAFTSQPAGIASQTQIWVMNSDTVSGRLWLIRSDGSENHQLSF
jgi:Tol biopolymer transport system component